MEQFSKFDLGSLPDWLKDSMESESVFVSPLRKSALGYRNSPTWKMLLEAAVVGPFLPRDLADGVVPAEQRQTAENALLEFAELTQTPDGPKWSLSNEARTLVLKDAVQSGEVHDAVRRTERRFSDSLSQSLRAILKTENIQIPNTSAAALEAQRLAVNLLSGISGVHVPAVESIESEIQFRRIMDPFERMIGQTPGENGESRQFFGRDEELENLREYVGVISSLQNLLGRATKAASRAYHGWRPLSIWGIGGAGKSSLIAKFMVEHAKVAQARFPFAYLDFDRPTISVRNAPGLLAEMCIQTGAQFKELQKPMDAIRAELRREFGSFSVTEQLESMSLLSHLLVSFRRQIDEFLSSQGWLFELERPFLLVFDTFELVQYSDDDVQALEQFVRSLGAPDWSRLRLVISGRQKVESFLGAPQPSVIGPLDIGSSAKLIMRVAEDAQKPVSSSDANKLVRAVAKITKITGERVGVHPLRLRLVGEQFQNKTDQTDGPSIVKSLLAELENPQHPTGEAGQAFIDGILIRRTINHISDQRVRALANPGLVVRRITPEVIQKVMTAGTPRTQTAKAGTSPTPTTTDLSLTTWSVDLKEARDIFEAFRREVSLIEVVDSNTLRHREDVRRQMLPSMRASPDDFERLNRLAYDYYSLRARTNADDFESAEESVYHGLWIGVPISELDELWPDAVTPRIDPAQFDNGSDAQVFLSAKLQKRLSLAEIGRLPPEMALEWLDARSADLLKDRNIQGSIDVIRSALQGKEGLLDDRPSTAATLACLLYRAGLWDEAKELAWHHLQGDDASELSEQAISELEGSGRETSSQSAPLVSLLRTLATVIARGSPHDWRWQWVERAAFHLNSPVAQTEVLAHCILARRARSELKSTSSKDLQRGLEQAAGSVNEKQWKRELSTLQLALAGGCRQTELLEMWVMASKQLPRDWSLDRLEDCFQQIIPDALSGRERAEPSLLGYGRKESWTERYNRLDKVWRNEKPSLMDACQKRSHIREEFTSLAVSDFSDWIRPIGNSLARALNAESNGQLQSMLLKTDFVMGRSRQTNDGVGLVQVAHENGRLWDLVKYMAVVPPKLPGVRDLIKISKLMFDWLKITRDSL